MPPSRSTRLLFASLVAATLPACAGVSFFGSGPTFADTAKGNYDRAMIELSRKNWLDAIKLFQYTKSKFSFSRYATLAELGIAEADFGREHYSEAIDGYRNFIKAHPTHERVVDGYAAFRIGEAFHKQIPTEWFLVPPAYEKDQGPVRDALRELSAFLAEYPDAKKYVPKAKALEEDCVRRLADHELYVADFYLKRKHPQAAAARLAALARGDFLPKLPAETPGDASGQVTQVAQDYLHTKIEARVLLQLAQTQLAIGHFDEAKQGCDKILATHADAPEAKKAKELLVEIERKRVADAGHGKK